MNERGTTLVESLVALLLLGIAVVVIVGGFTAMLDANTLTEERCAAVTAAEQTLEALRRVDPESLPSSGQSQPQQVQIDGKDYEVVTRYCASPGYCKPKSRHIEIEVQYDGKTIHRVETVFTQFK
jgi:type II secretory pathway pseudopilin PulG